MKSNTIKIITAVLSCSFFYTMETVMAQTPKKANIIFESGFEEGNKLIWDDWDGNPDTQNKLIAHPGPFNKPGNHVIQLFVTPGERGGSDLVKVLPSQHDSAFVSWYIQYEPGFNFDALNHGGRLFAGDRNLMGQSGFRPTGDDRVSCGIEYSPKLHTTQIYAYYRGMYQDCADPQGSCWGDVLPCTADNGSNYCTKQEHRDPPIPPTLIAGKWYHVEVKLKLGTPSVDGSIRDGEVALWVDGVNYGRWDGLWMRTDKNLKINLLSLALFHHDGNHSDAGVLYDDVKVTTTRDELTTDILNTEDIDSKVKVYPNPTLGILNIEGILATDQITLTVKNMLGEEMKVNHERFSNKIKVNTEHLPTGVYFLNMTYNGKESVHKIIKQN